MTPSKINLFLLCGALYFAVAAHLHPAEPMRGGPHFHAIHVGLAGLVRPGCWTQIRAVVQNPGPAVQARIIAVAGESEDPTHPIFTETPVFLPANSRRHVRLHMKAGLADEMSFELWVGENRVDQKKVRPILLAPGETTLMGLAVERSFGCWQESDISIRPHRVHFINAVEFKWLPRRWQALEALDAIILGGLPSGGLDVAQEMAIIQWVRAGGTLIFTPAHDPINYRESLLRQILPVELIGKRWVTHLRPLEEAYGPLDTQGARIPLAEAMPVDGRVLLAMDQLPLVVHRQEGTGNVYFVAFDLACDVMLRWRPLREFYLEMVKRRYGPPDPKRSMLAEAAVPLLHRMVGVKVPSRWVVGICLGINLAALIGLLVLTPRWRRVNGQPKHAELAWGLVLLLTPVFTVAWHGIGRAASGIAGHNLAQIYVIHSTSGSSEVDVSGFLGLFAAKETLCDVELAGEATLFLEDATVTAKMRERPGRRALQPSTAQQRIYRERMAGVRQPLRFHDGDIKRISQVRLKERALLPLQVSYLGRIEGTIEANAEYCADGVRVTVWNRSPHALRSPFVCVNRNARGLGDLAPGEKTTLLLTSDTALLTMQRFSRAAMKSEIEMLRDKIVGAVFSPRRVEHIVDTGVVVGGWIERAPCEIALSGLEGALRRTAETLWLVSATRTARGKRISLPKGTLALRPTAEAHALYEEGEWRPMAGEWRMPVKFHLPTELINLQPQMMRLYLRVGRAPVSIEAKVRDLRAGEWRPLVRTGDRTLISDPAGLISGSGTVEFDIHVVPKEEGSFGLVSRRPILEELDLEIEGSLP